MDYVVYCLFRIRPSSFHQISLPYIYKLQTKLSYSFLQIKHWRAVKINQQKFLLVLTAFHSKVNPGLMR